MITSYHRARTADVRPGDRVFLGTKAQRPAAHLSEFRTVESSETRRTDRGGTDRVFTFTDGSSAVFNPASKCWRERKAGGAA